MKKIDKKTLIITTLVNLIPIIVGLLIWDKLPDTIATHFGMDGTPNGWSSKAFTVFGIPLFLTFGHLLCIGITSQDPKYDNMSDKLFGLVLWMIPAISILLMVTCYGYSLGWKLNMSKYGCVVLGVMFMIIGNYLPKCKQNYTMGIKIPWTLDNEDNWNKTHRLAGFLWVIGGVAMVVNAFIGSEWSILVISVVMVFVPMIYSYLYFKKNK